MQKLIYIVDDETSVLETLGICLRRLNPDWIIREFTLPNGALEAIRQRPPHLVLTDQTMPGMTGSQMLDLVRQAAPQAVRIIISGHAAQTEKIGAAHQCLSKPFDVRDLQDRIRRALAAQETLRDPALRQLVGSLESFPVMPTAYAKLVRELEREDSSFDRIADLIAHDGGVLTRVLQMANSALFGRNSTITEPAEALMQLGTHVVRALVLSVHLFAAYQSCQCPEVPIDALWQHSCRSAHLAQQLCRQKLNEAAANDVLFAGLVQNLGRLILMENQPERFRQTCRRALAEKLSLVHAERDAFGAMSTELSAFMLHLWGLPETAIEAVIFCHAPWENPKSAGFNPATALYMADILMRQRQPPDAFATPSLNQDYLESVDAPRLDGLHDMTVV
jgi:HD-like signal output (HDOD) protein/CheY-like chemotaxis protein